MTLFGHAEVTQHLFERYDFHAALAHRVVAGESMPEADMTSGGGAASTLRSPGSNQQSTTRVEREGHCTALVRNRYRKLAPRP